MMIYFTGSTGGTICLDCTGTCIDTGVCYLRNTIVGRREEPPSLTTDSLKSPAFIERRPEEKKGKYWENQRIRNLRR